MKQEKPFFLTLPLTALIVLVFLLGTSEFIVIGILPELSDAFHISLAKASGIVSVFAVTYAAGTPFLTAFSGRFSRFQITLCFVGIFIITSFLCAVVTLYPLFLLFRIVNAVLCGTLFSLSMAYASEISTPENQPKAVAAIFLGTSIASVLGMPLATAVSQLIGWRGSFILIGVLSSAVLLVMYRTLPKHSGKTGTSVIRQFVIFKDARIISGVLCVMFISAGVYTVYTYLSPIFSSELKIPTHFLSPALVGYGLMAIFSNILSGKLAEKSGMRKMPMIFALQALCLAVMPLAVCQSISGFLCIYLLGLLMYLVNAPSQMLFMNVAKENYPDCVNLAASFSPVFYNFGIAIGSSLGGLIVNYSNLRFSSWGGSALSIVAIFCCIILNIRIKKITAPVRQ